MKIAIITADFPPFLSGVGDVVHRLAGALACEDEVHIVTTASAATHNTDAGPSASLQGVHVHRAADPGWNAASIDRVIDLCRACDVVNLHYPGVQFGRSLRVNLLPRMIRRRTGKRCVVTLHDFAVMRNRWRLRALSTLWLADAVIHVDAGDGPLVRRWLAPLPFKPSIHHVPIGVNIEPVACDAAERRAWRASLGLSDSDIAVVFFGILYPHKGVFELIEAMRQLAPTHQHLRLVVVGDFDRDADYVGPMTRALSAASIRWVRGARFEESSRCLHAADIAAMPYYSGAASNRSAMLSALAHGVPTITTDGPVTPAGFDRAFGVRLVRPRDVNTLRDAVAELADQPAVRAAMRQEALRIAAGLNWHAVARATRAVLQSCIAGAGSPSDSAPRPAG